MSLRVSSFCRRLRSVLLPLAGIILSMSGGCATQTPRYVENWDKLRVGMTRMQVRGLLGESPHIETPAQQDPTVHYEGDRPKRPASDADLAYERWHYGGRLETSDERGTPATPTATKTHIVFFDADGRLVKCRRPIEDD